jgi:tetratricopeptide (TPR) repeat protein
MVPSSPSSSLSAAESLLGVLEDGRERIRSLRRTHLLLDDLIALEGDSLVLQGPTNSPEPPVRSTRADVMAYEEQLTQALDPDLLDTLEDPPIEPPVRGSDTSLSTSLQDEKVDSPPPPEATEGEADSSDPTQPPVRTETLSKGEMDAQARADARARSAAEIRSLSMAAEATAAEVDSQSREEQDDAYRMASDLGVAAVQIMATGETREVRERVAIGEASDEDLNDEVERTSQSTESGGLQIDVLIPEVELEDDAHLPELTDSALPFSSLTGLEVKDTIEPGLIARFLGVARAAESRGDLQEAIVAYGDALDVNGELDIAWLGRGRCRTELGDFGAALSDLKRAQTIAPGSPEAVLEMGHLYYARKAYLQAIHYYGESLAIEPNSAIALARRGLCHHYMDEPVEALRDLQQAMEIDPDLPQLSSSLDMVKQSTTLSL